MQTTHTRKITTGIIALLAAAGLALGIGAATSGSSTAHASGAVPATWAHT